MVAAAAAACVDATLTLALTILVCLGPPLPVMLLGHLAINNAWLLIVIRRGSRLFYQPFNDVARRVHLLLPHNASFDITYLNVLSLGSPPRFVSDFVLSSWVTLCLVILRTCSILPFVIIFAYSHFDHTR